MDLPLLTEATSDFYRDVYADPALKRIFKGVNMVVLRNHVSYFLFQVAASDSGISQEQLDHLRQVHAPIIKEFHLTQYHFNLWMSYLLKAMRCHGAEESLLELVTTRLAPVQDMFPADSSRTANGTASSHTKQSDLAAANRGFACQSGVAKGPTTAQQHSPEKPCEATAHVMAAGRSGKQEVQQGHSSDQCKQAANSRQPSCLQHLTSCICRSSADTSAA